MVREGSRFATQDEFKGCYSHPISDYKPIWTTELRKVWNIVPRCPGSVISVVLCWSRPWQERLRVTPEPYLKCWRGPSSDSSVRGEKCGQERVPALKKDCWRVVGDLQAKSLIKITIKRSLTTCLGYRPNYLWDGSTIRVIVRLWYLFIRDVVYAWLGALFG